MVDRDSIDIDKNNYMAQYHCFMPETEKQHKKYDIKYLKYIIVQNIENMKILKPTIILYKILLLLHFTSANDYEQYICDSYYFKINRHYKQRFGKYGTFF